MHQKYRGTINFEMKNSRVEADSSLKNLNFQWISFVNSLFVAPEFLNNNKTIRLTE